MFDIILIIFNTYLKINNISAKLIQNPVRIGEGFFYGNGHAGFKGHVLA